MTSFSTPFSLGYFESSVYTFMHAHVTATKKDIFERKGHICMRYIRFNWVFFCFVKNMYSLFKSSVDTTKVLEKQQILLHFREDMLRLKKKIQKKWCKHHFFTIIFKRKLNPQSCILL